MRISDTPPTPFPAKLDFIRAELEALAASNLLIHFRTMQSPADG